MVTCGTRNLLKNGKQTKMLRLNVIAYNVKKCILISV